MFHIPADVNNHVHIRPYQMQTVCQPVQIEGCIFPEQLGTHDFSCSARVGNCNDIGTPSQLFLAKNDQLSGDEIHKRMCIFPAFTQGFVKYNGFDERGSQPDRTGQVSDYRQRALL